MTAPLRLGPGIYEDMTAAAYHADPGANPTLSSSIAKTILAQTPRHAWCAHPRLNPTFGPEEGSKFSLGSVVHEILLGRGAGFDVLEYDDYRTKDAKEKRDASWLAGRTPILEHQHVAAVAMADAVISRIRLVPECRPLFLGGPAARGFVAGRGERVLIWRDAGGPLCRAMVDWMGPTDAEIWDVKTTGAGLSDYAIGRTVAALDYDLSAGFYLRGLNALLPHLAGRFKWRWIFIEDAEPFECRVVDADAAILALGDRKAALAIEKWRRCLDADLWPGYAPEVTRVACPPWNEARWMERELTDPDADRMVVSSRPAPRNVDSLLGAEP